MPLKNINHRLDALSEKFATVDIFDLDALKELLEEAKQLRDDLDRIQEQNDDVDQYTITTDDDA